jgi:type IV pilus assembly protein PilC
MPQYQYTALSQNGALIVGESAAASPENLKAELENLGLRAQRISIKRNWAKMWRRSTVRPEVFLLFVQEFISLMRAGLPLPEVLALAADRPGEPELGRVLSRVLKDVRAGMLLSQACSVHPDIFDGLFLASLRTGEKAGELPTVLARYQEFLRRQVALRKKISQALAYPVFLLVALSVILGVMFAFVMPRFVSMYANFDAKLPVPTQWLLAAVENFPIIALVCAVIGASALFGWGSYSMNPTGRLNIDRWKLRAPLIGDAARTAAIAHLARSLATLLGGGTPLVEALRTVQESFPNRAFALQVAEVAQRVTQGESLAKAVRATELMPETAIKMLQVGEASGGLDRMLAEVAQFYEDALENRLARIMSLIEPVLVFLMGVMIGGIIIVMYLPIFNLAEVIR